MPATLYFASTTALTQIVNGGSIMKFSSLPWALVIAGTFFVGEARATCCLSNADCPKGFACSGTFAADSGLHGDCDSTFVACTCDSDCAPGLRCIPNAANVCIQTIDAGTQTCRMQGQCGAAWQRPCATSDDCGPGGFQCTQAGEICQGIQCQAANMCSDPTLPSACTLDQDCPNGWTCEPDTNVTGACIPNLGFGPPVPLTGALSCKPPHYDLVGGKRWSGPPSTPDPTCPAVDNASGTDAGVAQSQRDAGLSNGADASQASCACNLAATRRPGSWGVCVVAACLASAFRRRDRALRRLSSTR